MSQILSFRLIAFFVAGNLLLLWSAMFAPFIFDDGLGILENPAIQTLEPRNLLFASPPDSTPYGRPMVLLTLAINHLLCGLNPLGFRLFNVLLHAINAALFYSLVQGLLQLANPTTSRANLIGFISATLWLVHPLTTNVSLYIVQRAEGLVTCCLLLTLVAATQFFLSLRKNDPDAAGKWSKVCIIWCWVGMLAKESMVIAPLAVLLLDVLLGERTLRTVLRKRGIWYAKLFGSWGLLAAVMWIWPRSQSVGAVEGLSSYQYLVLQAEIILGYIGKLLYPTGLVIDYWLYQPSPDGRWILGAVLLIGLLGVACSVLINTKHVAGYLVLLFFLCLAPTSSIVPIHSMTGAEYRMYFPSACLIAAIVIVTDDVLARWAGHVLGNRILILSSFTIFCCLSLQLTRRANDFREPEQLWRQVLYQFPDNPRALNALAAIESKNQNYAAAERLLRQAIGLHPGHADAYLQLAMLKVDSGDLPAAQELLVKSTELWPYNAVAWMNLGGVAAELNEVELADRAFRQSLALNSRNSTIKMNFAIFLMRSGKRIEARQIAESVLLNEPTNETARKILDSIERLER